MTVQEIKPFEALNKVKEIKYLYIILKDEKPETIGLVLSYIDSTKAAELLELFGNKEKVEIARSIMEVEKVNRETLYIIENHIHKKIESIIDNDPYNGRKKLIEILNHLNRNTEQIILEGLNDHNLNEQVIVFEDIFLLSNNDTMILLNEIMDNEIIATVLTNKEIRKKFLKNMAEARRLMVEDIEEGLTRPSKESIEHAEKIITEHMRRLIKDGRIECNKKN